MVTTYERGPWPLTRIVTDGGLLPKAFGLCYGFCFDRYDPCRQTRMLVYAPLGLNLLYGLAWRAYVAAIFGVARSSSRSQRLLDDAYDFGLKAGRRDTEFQLLARERRGYQKGRAHQQALLEALAQARTRT